MGIVRGDRLRFHRLVIFPSPSQGIGVKLAGPSFKGSLRELFLRPPPRPESAPVTECHLSLKTPRARHWLPASRTLWKRGPVRLGVGPPTGPARYAEAAGKAETERASSSVTPGRDKVDFRLLDFENVQCSGGRLLERKHADVARVSGFT